MKIFLLLELIPAVLRQSNYFLEKMTLSPAEDLLNDMTCYLLEFLIFLILNLLQ